MYLFLLALLRAAVLKTFRFLASIGSHPRYVLPSLATILAMLLLRKPTRMIAVDTTFVFHGPLAGSLRLLLYLLPCLPCHLLKIGFVFF